MMLRRLIAITAALFVALPALAQEASDDERALLEALAMRDILEIMREEGIAYGADLGAEMFAGTGGGAQWAATVERIYDIDAMEATVTDRFLEEIDPEAVGPLLDFFTSDMGRQIISLEVSARRALLDDAVEAASEDAYAEAEAEGDPRLDLVRRFVEVNDLVERNVMGAMNSNYAFYTGLVDGGAFDFEMTEDQILADVWGQEPEIRSDTTEWLYSYLLMAYRPLEDEVLETYIELSQTEEGRELNGALFAGYDEMFNKISRALGLAAGRAMGGEEL